MDELAPGGGAETVLLSDRPAEKQAAETAQRSRDEPVLPSGTHDGNGLGSFCGRFEKPLHAMEISAFNEHRAMRSFNGNASWRCERLRMQSIDLGHERSRGATVLSL